MLRRCNAEMASHRIVIAVVDVAQQGARCLKELPIALGVAGAFVCGPARWTLCGIAPDAEAGAEYLSEDPRGALAVNVRGHERNVQPAAGLEMTQLRVVGVAEGVGGLFFQEHRIRIGATGKRVSAHHLRFG